MIFLKDPITHFETKEEKNNEKKLDQLKNLVLGKPFSLEFEKKTLQDFEIQNKTEMAVTLFLWPAWK